MASHSEVVGAEAEPAVVVEVVEVDVDESISVVLVLVLFRLSLHKVHATFMVMPDAPQTLSLILPKRDLYPNLSVSVGTCPSCGDTLCYSHYPNLRYS